MLTTTKRFRNACFLVSCILLCGGCHLKPKPFFPSSMGNMTLTLNGIFSHCYSHLSGSQIITYSGTVDVSYFDGSERRPLDPVNFSSGSNPANPVVVTVSIPSDGTHYDLHIVVNGLQCSKCAMQSYNGNECIQYIDPSGAYHAAQPRLDVQTYAYTSYRSTMTLDLSHELFAGNVLCDCVVPQ